MPKYDYLIDKACYCMIQATDARIRGDVNMQKFWNNAYDGFLIKASRLVEEEQHD